VLPRREPPPARSQLFLTLGGLVDEGTMRAPPAGGFEAAAGWSRRAPAWRVRALVGAGYFPTQRAASSTTGEGGEFWLLTVSGRSCLTAAGARFEIGPCLGAELAVMRGAGTGSDAGFQAGSATGLWLAALGSAVVSWSLTPALALFGRGDLVVPTVRRSFVVMPGNVEVHRVAAVGGRGAVGIELRFF